MDRLKSFVVLVALLCTGVLLVGSAQDNPGQLTIDVTKQQSPPPRGRGPFPSSPGAGHSAGLPIRLELLMPTRELRPDGTAAVDFIITNISTKPIKLPCSVALVTSPMEALTLWLTSDAIKDQYLTGVKIEMVWISAELDGRNDDQKSFYALAPNKSIRVHASSPQLIAGAHTFTAHAELTHITNTTKVIGTADSDAVKTTYQHPVPHPDERPNLAFASSPPNSRSQRR